MKSDVQKAGACRVKMSVEASAEEIDPIYADVHKAFTSQVKLPGFRPGKAPWARIEALYGDAIREETNKRVIGKLLSAANEAKIRMVAFVDIEGLQSAKGSGASATFVLDVAPEVKLPDIKKWQIKKLDETVTDEAIEARLADVRRMAASFREATAEDTATEDDLVAISFTSDLNKDDLSDAAKHYASDEEYWVQLREDAFIPGLRDVLLGKKLGDNVSFTGTYPKDFRIEDLAGKKVKYDATLKTMRKLTPADDATVIARFGAKDMDELKKAVTDNLTASKHYEEEQRATQELCEAIDSSVKFDLPARILDERIYDELATDPAKPLETYKNDVEGLKKSDIYKAATERATKNLRRFYVLEQIAEERGIKLEAAEVDAALDNIGQAYGIKRDEVLKRLRNNDRLNEFLARERTNKMLHILLHECATK